MEGSRHHRQAMVSLQREFMSSRLEQQILVRTFELVVPADGTEPGGEEPNKSSADQPSSATVRSQGEPQS